MSDPGEIFSKIPELDHQEEMKKVDPGIFENIIHNRRSVRVYTDEKIPEEVVQKVLEWTLMAPNSSNLQCWEFYWVRDPKKKEKMVKALFSQPAARTAQEIIVAVARMDRWKNIRKQMLDHFKTQQKTPASAKAYYEKLVPIVYNQGPLGSFGFIKKMATSVIGLARPVAI